MRHLWIKTWWDTFLESCSYNFRCFQHCQQVQSHTQRCGIPAIWQTLLGRQTGLLRSTKPSKCFSRWLARCLSVEATSGYLHNLGLVIVRPVRPLPLSAVWVHHPAQRHFDTMTAEAGVFDQWKTSLSPGPWKEVHDWNEKPLYLLKRLS